MALKLEMLRCFVAVAQAGSLADAASRLGRTPSAISMTLKQLEAHLGQRLFESDRKARLTPLGEFVLEQAQAELDQFDNTIREIETFASLPGGLVRIATVPSVAGLIFPAAIEQFSLRHPGVSVEVRDMDSANVQAAMARGQADIGIATSAGALRDIHQKFLFADAFGLICSGSHPLSVAASVTVADLKAHRFVKNALCRNIRAPKFQALLSQTLISAQNTLSLVAMVRSGGWITVLPRSVIHIDPNQLRFRALQDLDEHRRVDLLYKYTDHNRAFIQDFVELLSGTDWRAHRVEGPL